MKAVSLDQITHRFDSERALDDIHFDVDPGELFGVIGPDGAGKSTLFRIVASLLIPESGQCRVWGIDTVTDYKEIRRMIGYMPGRFSLYMDLTVEENLAFYARVFGTRVDENLDLVREVYEQIEPFRKRRAGKLSGGMKQKLALSCALIHRPRLLILDEPTTGVDAVSRMEFWEMLESIREEGITVLVSTPYMDEAELCDRVAMIQKGILLEVSDPGKIRGSGKKLYSIRSGRGLYGYLDPLRSLPGCLSAWLFGDEIHVRLESPDALKAMESMLGRAGDPSLRWERKDPTFEDRFMERMQQENQEEEGML